MAKKQEPKEKNYYFSNGWKHWGKDGFELNLIKIDIEFCKYDGAVSIDVCLLNFYFGINIKVCKGVEVPFNGLLDRQVFVHGYLQQNVMDLLAKRHAFGSKKKEEDAVLTLRLSKKALPKSTGWSRVFIQWALPKEK